MSSEANCGGILFFPSIHKPFQEWVRDGGAGEVDDVLPGMVVSVCEISCPPDADFVPKLLIPFDTVNDRGDGCLEKQRPESALGAADNVFEIDR